MNARGNTGDTCGWVQAWNRFWFAEGSPETLGLLRIFIGLALLMKLTGATGMLANFGVQVEFPRPTFATDSAWFLGGYRLPFPGFEFLPALGYYAFGFLDALVLVLAVLWTGGWKTSWTGWSLAGVYTFQVGQSQFFYHHHIFLLVLLLWILAPSPCGRHFSIDAWLRGGVNREPASLLARRMIQVLVSAIYLFAGLAKCNSGWFSGEVLDALIDNDQVVGVVGGPLLRSLPLALFTWSTILAELFLAVGLWWGPTRKPAFLVGIGLHLGIATAMEVETFGWTMLALYIAFLDPRCGSQIVVYDSNRLPTRALVRLARWGDWFQRMSWIRRNDLSETDLDLWPPRGTTAGTPAGPVSGRQAWLIILEKLPITFVPAWLIRQSARGMAWFDRRPVKFG